jgi:hypothetical protein
MVTAIVAVVVVIGLIFVLSQAQTLLRVLTIVLLVVSLGYAGYSEYPSVQTDYAQIDSDYEAESGEFYSVDETAFQVKQQLLSVHVVSALPAFFNAAWLSTGIMIVLLGVLGMKEVFSYAAIPANQSSRSLDSNAEITDDVAPVTNRPTAEQRAAALAHLKATSASTSAPAAEAASAAPAPTPAPAFTPKPAEEHSSTQSPFSMPAFSEDTAAPEPVIKISEPRAMSSASTMDTTYSKRNLDSPVTPSGKINIKLDLGEDPQVTVEEANVYKSADGTTSYYEEPISTAENPFASMGNPFGQKAEPTPAAEPVPAPMAEPEPAPVLKPIFLSEPAPAAEPEPVSSPVPTPAPKPTPAPAAEANPFASMGNPFEKKAAPVVEPAPAPAPAVEQTTPAPAPTPAPAAAPTPAPAPTQPAKTNMSAEAKQRIKELNQQVADLKTLYNQGMISQDEYIAQRTEILQQMYNSEK